MSRRVLAAALLAACALGAGSTANAGIPAFGSLGGGGPVSVEQPTASASLRADVAIRTSGLAADVVRVEFDVPASATAAPTATVAVRDAAGVTRTSVVPVQAAPGVAVVEVTGPVASESDLTVTVGLSGAPARLAPSGAVVAEFGTGDASTVVAVPLAATGTTIRL